MLGRNDMCGGKGGGGVGGGIQTFHSWGPSLSSSGHVSCSVMSLKQWVIERCMMGRLGRWMAGWSPRTAGAWRARRSASTSPGRAKWCALPPCQAMPCHQAALHPVEASPGRQGRWHDLSTRRLLQVSAPLRLLGGASVRFALWMSPTDEPAPVVLEYQVSGSEAWCAPPPQPLFPARTALPRS